MSEAFDPDAYLKERGITPISANASPSAGGFDPDAFLAESKSRGNEPEHKTGVHPVDWLQDAGKNFVAEHYETKALNYAKNAEAILNGDLDGMDSEAFSRVVGTEGGKPGENRVKVANEYAKRSAEARAKADEWRVNEGKGIVQRVRDADGVGAKVAEGVTGVAEAGVKSLPGLAKIMGAATALGAGGLPRLATAVPAVMMGDDASDSVQAAALRERLAPNGDAEPDADSLAGALAEARIHGSDTRAANARTFATTVGMALPLATRAGQAVERTAARALADDAGRVAMIPAATARAAGAGASGLTQGTMGAGADIAEQTVNGDKIDLDRTANRFVSDAALGVAMDALHSGEGVRDVREARRIREPVAPKQGTSEANQGTQTREPAPRSESREPVSTDDLLGDGDLKARIRAEAEGEAQQRKRDALVSASDADLFARFGKELRTRADRVRENGGEGDSFLSAAETELKRAADEQQGRGRDFTAGDFSRRLDAVLPDADPDFRDALALRLYGADAASSRDKLAYALGTVTRERARAYGYDTPQRSARVEAERATAEAERVKAETSKAETARLTAEHEAEISRLDEARVTPEGEPDFKKFSDDELADFAHGEDATPHLKTIAEAQRLQDAHPDYAEKPRGTLANEWRAKAAKEFDARMQEQEAGAQQGPSLRELLLKGKIQLPAESATYSGELRALKESFTPGEQLRIFRKVNDAAAGDSMLERLAERLTVDEGFGFLQSSGADLLDAVSRSAAGEHLRPDWAGEGVSFSRQSTIDLGDQGVGYELPNSIRNLTPKWGERTLDFRSSLDKAVYYATAGEPSATRDAVRAHIEDETGVGHGVIAAMGRALRERIRTEATRSGERITVPEVTPRIVAERDGVLFSRTGIDSAKRPDTLVSHDAQAQADAALATEALRKFGELGAQESLVPVELRKGRDTRELAEQIRGARGIAKAFGRRLTLFRAPEDFPADGFVLRSHPDLIFLNIDAQRPVLAVTGHELMHGMETDAPRLAAAVKESLREYRSHFEVYEAFAKRDGYRAGQIESEFAADVLGDTLLRKTFVDRLAAKSPRVFAEFINYARRFIADLKARLMADRAIGEQKPMPGYGTRNFLNHLDAVDEMLARALVKWRDRIRNGTTGENDIGVRNLEDPALRPFKYEPPAPADESPVLMSRRKAKAPAADPVREAEAALDAAKAERDKLTNNPDDVNWRRATAKVRAARNALTDARAQAVKTAPDALPLGENERAAATRRLADAQEELSKLQAMGKKIGGESYKDAPVYKQALAERDAAFAAVTELSKSAPAPKADRLAELSVEREKLFRELNEGQPSPEDATTKQARLAELNREIKAAERGAEKPAPASFADWSPEKFDASAWAMRLASDDIKSIPGRDHFAALNDNRIGELETELKGLRDKENAGRVDTIVTNLRQILRDRRTRGAPPEITTPSPSEKTSARERLAPDAPDDISPERMERAKRRLKRLEDLNAGKHDELFDDQHGPVPVDELTLPREVIDNALPEEPPVALSREDLEAVAKMPSTQDAGDADFAKRELSALDERDALDAEIQAALDELPPAPPASGGDMPVREGGPAKDVYGHKKFGESSLSSLANHVKDVVRGFRSAVPELSGAEHRATPEVMQGYKDLKRAGEIAMHDATQVVQKIIRPIAELDSPLDAKALQALGKVRERQNKAAKEAEVARAEGRDSSAKRAETEMLQSRKEAEALIEKMSDSPWVIFENFILWRDLMHRAATLRRTNGEAITLPFGVNGAEAATEARKWAERLQESPHRDAILEAVRNHEKFVTESWSDFEKRNLPVTGVWNGGKAYFPHVLPDHWSGKADRVAMTTGADFRKYLQDPVGSKKRIVTDYVQAMWHHAAAIATDNAHQDVVERNFKKLDITETLKAEQAEMRRTGVKDIPALGAMIPDGYVKFNPGDELRFARQPVIDRDKLSRALGRVIGSGPLAEELAKLRTQGITIRPEWLKEQLVKVESEDWIIPEKAADALRGIMKREEAKRYENPIARAMQTVNGAWKKHVLGMGIPGVSTPFYIRYEYGNTTADVMKLFAADPAVLLRLPEAYREVKDFIAGAPDEQVSPEVRRAFRLGVFETPTVSEVGELHELPGAEMFRTDRQKAARKILGWMGKDWSKYTKYKEATLRYAKYKADLERLDNGARPVIAGAYWKDIANVGESYPGAGDKNARIAAAISLATLNDIHSISVSGQHLRKTLIPFYSFLENNFRFMRNFFLNGVDAVRGKNPYMDGRAAVGAGARLVAPFFAAALYNAMVGGDDELSDEDRRRLHINLGRDARGRMRVLYVNNDFADVMRWFAGPRAAASLLDVVKGKTDFGTAAADFGKNFWKDPVNAAAGIGPIPRIALDLIGKSAFPDVTELKSIPAYDIKWAVLNDAVGMLPADLARRALDKDYYSPRDSMDWLTQLVGQVRRRDPEQWAYYDLRDKAENFAEERTGRRRDPGSVDAPDAVALRNFRSAIYRGDMDAAVRLYSSLLGYGYTADRLRSSIAAQDPLAGLSKADGSRAAFIASLDEQGRRQLARAFTYYERMAALKNSERILFPSKGHNDAATEIRLDAFRKNPRTEELRAILEREAAQSDADKETESRFLERMSLRHSR